MSTAFLSLTLIVLAVAGFWFGRARALAVVGGDIRKLHSLPTFYGRITALMAAVPAFGLIIIWLLAQPSFIDSRAAAMLQIAEMPDGSSQSLIMADVRRVAAGLDRLAATGANLTPLLASPAALKTALNAAGIVLETEPTVSTLAAAEKSRELAASSRFWMTVAALSLAALGLLVAYRRIAPAYRARAAVERFVMVLLIASSLIAVLTTAGIVGSLLIESIHFFQLYPAKDFFFSTTWNPKFGGGSSLGIWPLVWGTLYVSAIALIVAVPIGLMSAIYLAEYASRTTRAWVKPAIEILAGIPTIVMDCSRRLPWGLCCATTLHSLWGSEAAPLQS